MDSRVLPAGINTYKLVASNLDVLYPQILEFKHPKAIRMVNKDIQREVKQLIKDQGYFENNVTEMLGTYELKNNQREILSLLLINYVYYFQAAHGMTINRGITYDVVAGKKYLLSELFKPESNYVKILSDIVSKQIIERDITLLGDFEGIKPEQDFYIADKCLVIFFQLYEITPYSAGFQYFPISIYEIQDIIDEDGPLGKMLY